MELVEIAVGPSHSKTVREVRDDFADHVTEAMNERCGLRLVLRVARTDIDTLEIVLATLSRIRKLVVRYDSEEYGRADFLYLLAEERYEAARAARRKAFEEAGAWWPLPDAEFLALASATAGGGDWSFEDDEPMSPEDRRYWIRVFSGKTLSESEWVPRALDVLKGMYEGGYYPLAREMESRFDIRHFMIESELREAMRVFRQQNADSPDSLAVFASVYPDCCVLCRRLYLEPDGRTPRLFLPDELPESGSNSNRELDQWLPTVPPLHLNCGCTLTPWFSFYLIPEVDGRFPEGYQPRVTRLPSWEREPLSAHKR